MLDKLHGKEMRGTTAARAKLDEDTTWNNMETVE